jgi:Caspase domain
MSKIALVIGNSNYGDSNFVSGVEDAKAMSDCLKGLGFEVLDPVLDGNLQATNDALKEFGQKIGGASVALFFYSGHAYQVGGTNFLLPPNSPVSIAGSVRLDTVVQKMGLAPSGAVKFVFLDACRDGSVLPAGASKGLAAAPAAPVGLLQAFAASPGQLAASGSADALSPYTAALVRYLPQAGLELRDLFDEVRADVKKTSPQQQEPIEAGALPGEFFFRPPVFIPTDFPDRKSELLVFLRGELTLDTSQPAKDAAGQPVKPTLRLNAGDNELVLMVSNGKSHRNNHDWDITEGWSYQLDLTLPDGTGLSFTGSEDIPFKDGPHYGKVFRVAQVNFQVDPQSGVLAPPEPQTDLANTEAPFFARDQQTLVQVSIADLNLSPDDILGDALNLGSVAAILKPFLVQFLKDGSVLGTTIADPAKTFVTVQGNVALKDLAAGCMADKPARIADLKASIVGVFARKPTPFDTFDQGLMACMRARALSQGNPILPDAIQVWTALQDLSNQPPAVVPAAPVAVANAVPAPDLVPVG